MSKATKKTIIFTLIALAEIFIIGLVPAESALISRAGWQYIGIFVALLTLSISNAMPGFAIGLLCLTAIALFNIAPFSAVYAQFSSTTVWLIIAIYLLCIGIGNSGIMQRIALNILKLFPKSYKGAALSMLTTSLVMAPFLPSTTAKVGIMSPMATEITKSYGFEKRSKQALGIWAAAFIPGWFWGFAFLSGSANVPIYLGFIGDAASFTWGSWFVFSVIWLLVAIAGVFIYSVVICAPRKGSSEVKVEGDVVKEKLAALGPMSLKEKQAAVILAIGVALWLTQSLHGIHATVVAIFMVVAMICCGLISPAEFSAKGNWSLIVYIATLLAISGFMSTTGVGSAIASLLGGVIAPIAQNPYIFVPCLVLLTYALRFACPDPFTAMAIFIGIFAPVIPQFGINLAVVVFVCGISGQIFWLPYQNGLLYGLAGMAGGEYVTFADVPKANWVFMIFNLIGMTASVPLWQMLGFC